MWHVRGDRRCKKKIFLWGYLKDVENLEDPGVDGRIILRWIFKNWDWEARTGLIWLRIGSGGGHL